MASSLRLLLFAQGVSQDYINVYKVHNEMGLASVKVTVSL